MIYGLSHIVGEILGAQPTMNQAASSAEMTGQKLAQGGRFKCPRLGMLTREMCLENFMSGHLACTTGFDCGIGAGEARKEGIEVGYKDKYGDCDCGKTHVRLDKYGRCYKCQEAIREAAKEERKTRVIGPTPDAPSKPGAAVQETQEPDDGQMVGPRVEEAGEKLKATTEGLRPLANILAALTLPDGIPSEGQLVGDEDPAPGACQGWPETAGTLVIDGMEFEAFAPRRKPGLKSFVSLQSGKTFNFSPGAVRQFDMLRYHHVELHYSRSGGAIAFILHEQKPDGANTLSLYAPKARDRARVGAQGFMRAFGLNLEGKGPWLVEQPQPGVLVARVG